MDDECTCRESNGYCRNCMREYISMLGRKWDNIDEGYVSAGEECTIRCSDDGALFFISFKGDFEEGLLSLGIDYEVVKRLDKDDEFPSILNNGRSIIMIWTYTLVTILDQSGGGQATKSAK